MQIWQPSFLDLLKPDQPIDDDIIIIGNPKTHHNIDRFEEFYNEFSIAKIFATDSETYGDENWKALYFRYSRIRLLQIGLENGKVLIIDFGGWFEKEKWDEILQDPYVVKILSLYAEKCFDKTVAVLGVNLKFDLTLLLEKFGIKVRQCRDLMILSQVVWAGLGVSKAQKGENRAERCKISHGLKGFAQRLGFEVDKTEQSSQWGFTLDNSQINYAANDVRILFPIYLELRKLVKKFGLTYTAYVECNGVSAFADMEWFGIPINKNTVHGLIEEFQAEKQQQLEVFTQYFPTVQYTSNPQVLEALKTVDPSIESVSKDVLYSIEHPAAKALIKVRALDTDIDYLQRTLDCSFEGRIRSVYRQIAASGNGRSSCTGDIRDPKTRKKYPVGNQLQNPSKHIRDIFEAAPGYVFFDFDGAQMHARIATQCSGSVMLQKIFNDDFDGHSILAGKIAKLSVPVWQEELKRNPDSEELKILLSVEWNEQLIADIKSKKDYTKNFNPLVKKIAIDFRNVAKTALYSILNGSMAGRLMLAMHSAGYEWFTFEQAKDLLTYFDELYPELRSYIKESIAKANQVQYDFSSFKDVNDYPLEGKWGLTKCLTGRHVFFKMYPNKFKPHILEVNPTDCTASQWTPVEKDIMIHWAFEVLWEADNHPEWDLHMCNLPHDQGTFHAKEEYAEEIAPMIVNKFNEVASRWIKLIPMVEQSDLDNPLSCVKKILTK